MHAAKLKGRLQLPGGIEDTCQEALHASGARPARQVECHRDAILLVIHDHSRVQVVLQKQPRQML